jgi:hypothetical protein
MNDFYSSRCQELPGDVLVLYVSVLPSIGVGEKTSDSSSELEKVSLCPVQENMH